MAGNADTFRTSSKSLLIEGASAPVSVSSRNFSFMSKLLRSVSRKTFKRKVKLQTDFSCS